MAVRRGNPLGIVCCCILWVVAATPARAAADGEGGAGRVDPAVLNYAAPKNIGAAAPRGENDFVILFKGNSITRHGTNPDIAARLGWDRECGMAASSEARDYAHLLAAKIQALDPARPVRLAFGRQDAEGSEKDAALRPDLVVVQTGEHSQGDPKGADAFPPLYRRTLETVLAYPGPPKVIALGVWAAGDGGRYGGFTARIQAAQREITAELGVMFVSVEDFARDPSCWGDGKDAGVRWHPNDRGMAAYADAAFAAYRTLIEKREGRAPGGKSAPGRNAPAGDDERTRP